MMMFSSTLWNWLRSIVRSGMFGPASKQNSTPLTRAWLATRGMVALINSFKSVLWGSSLLWREKSRRPFTILRTRSVAAAMVCRSSRISASMSWRLSSMWVKVSTPVSGLLISWATPAARRPTEACFSLCKQAQLAFGLLVPVAFPQGGEHLLEGALQHSQLAARIRPDLRAQVPLGDALAHFDEALHRIEHSRAQQAAEEHGQRHAGGGDEHEHQHGIAPQVRVLGFQHPHVQHAHRAAVHVGDWAVGRDVPVAHHEGPRGPALSLVQHPVLDLHGGQGADGPLAPGVQHVGGDAQVAEEDRRRAQLPPAVDLLLEHGVPHPVHDLVVSV